MSDPTLFDLPEQGNRFMEPLLTPQERSRRMRDTPPVSHLVSNDHPLTSVQAAIAVRPKIRGIKLAILALLDGHPEGLTVSQMCELLRREKPSVSPRMSDLVENGLVYEAGVGVSNNGNPATIYKIK